MPDIKKKKETGVMTFEESYLPKKYHSDMEEWTKTCKESRGFYSANNKEGFDSMVKEFLDFSPFRLVKYIGEEKAIIYAGGHPIYVVAISKTL